MGGLAPPGSSDGHGWLRWTNMAAHSRLQQPGTSKVKTIGWPATAKTNWQGDTSREQAAVDVSRRRNLGVQRRARCRSTSPQRRGESAPLRHHQVQAHLQGQRSPVRVQARGTPTAQDVCLPHQIAVTLCRSAPRKIETTRLVQVPPGSLGNSGARRSLTRLA